MMTNEETERLKILEENAFEYDRLKRQRASDEAHTMRLAQQREQDAVDAAKQAEADASAERDRLAANFAALVVPETTSIYNALPNAAKVELIKAFGQDFPRLLMAKEKTGLDWTSYRRMQYAKAIAPPASNVEHLGPGSRYHAVDGVKYLITPDGRRTQVTQ